MCPLDQDEVYLYSNSSKYYNQPLLLCFPKGVFHWFHILLIQLLKHNVAFLIYSMKMFVKVALLTFSGPSLSINKVAVNNGKTTTTALWDKDENLFWAKLRWHRSRHSNEMRWLSILLAVVFLSTGIFFTIAHAKSMKALSKWGIGISILFSF